jgi:hypothetical protein
MILFVSGFTGRQSALQFEWAWQHPTRSTKLQFSKSPTGISGQLRVLKSLLLVPPWNQESLCITFTSEMNRKQVLKVWDGEAPVHVRTTVHSLEEIARKIKCSGEDDFVQNCAICLNREISSNGYEFIACPGCGDSVHVLCLAQEFATEDRLIPNRAQCSGCGDEFTWKEWISDKQ